MTQRPSVLIIEDIPGTLAGNVAELSFADVTIHSSSTVAEALDRLEKNQYAVVLLDWRIPAEPGAPVDDDGGVKVLQAMEQSTRNRDTPVVVVTAHRNAVDSARLGGFLNVKAVVSKLRHDYIKTLLENILGVQLSVSV